jgi:Rps23 Pro-64 3,4-dihydroxylase Tpa1-like proline 4-hydroxylase/SAM-dependent methyltransferase
MDSVLSQIRVDPQEYKSKFPYPYGAQDNFLGEDFAKSLQREILDIKKEDWDRYDNPFEQKYTLRDKYNFPPFLVKLFDELTAKNFVNHLSEVVGHKLILDSTRNFWGVHIYEPGDKLDIHVDAGYHPTLKLKKQTTLGIYLSYEWKEEYGCALEIWRGDNCAKDDAKIHEKIDSISPIFNRLILFNCNDYAWHGNPEPSRGSPESRRIFITISYLSENFSDDNKKVKAFFVPRPNDPEDKEKDRLRFLRADPEKYKEIYRLHDEPNKEKEIFWNNAHSNELNYWINSSNSNDILNYHNFNQNISDKLILDLGIGLGYLTEYLSKNNKVISVDISDVALEKVKEFAYKTYNTSELSKIEPVDLAICNLVFQHCDDEEVERIIREIQLKDDGIFSFQFAFLRENEEPNDFVKELIKNKTHYFRSFEKIKEFVNKCGKKIVSISEPIHWRHTENFSWLFVKISN